MKASRRITIFFQKTLLKNRGPFFGQEGEDVIIYNLLKKDCSHDLSTIRYLDVGCGHPLWLNNTYILYKYGAKGWCIDANGSFEILYKIFRNRDSFIKACVGPKDKDVVTFYQTYNRERATAILSSYKICLDQKIRLKRKNKMPMSSLNFLIKKYVGSTHIDLLNLDVEGLENAVLKSVNFNTFHPTIVCVEVVDYTNGYNHHETLSIIDYMKEFGYILCFNTIVNLIFVDEEYWNSRRYIHK